MNMDYFDLFGLTSYARFSILLAVVFVGISFFLWYLRRNDKYWELRGVPFFPRLSILGIVRLLSKMSLSELQQMAYKKYGKVYGGFQFSTPGLNVAEPDLLRDILVKDFQSFTNRRDVSFKHPLLDNMVSVLKGENWKRVRTIITPAFTSKQMRKMGNIINNCSETVIQKIGEHFQKGEQVDFKELFGAFTVDVIALAAFATRIDSLNDPDNIFMKMVKLSSQELSLFRFLILILLPQRLVNFLRLGGLKSVDFFKQIVLEVMQQRRKDKQKYDDFLQTLMDAAEELKSGSKTTSTQKYEDDTDHYGSVTSSHVTATSKSKWLSETELVAQCVLFFFAGYETTASTLAFMAYALALNQEWQEKLIVEVDESFQKHTVMSHDAVRDMKILDAVISETLRMYPPAVVSERSASEDYNLGNTGIVIEKGMAISFPIYAMHYDPEFFSDPEIFNPERFMDSEKYNHPQYAYLPFGAGPRNCLGMRFALLEIKLLMADILRHYRFKIGPDTKVPLEYKKQTGFLSVNELLLAVEKRNDTGT